MYEKWLYILDAEIPKLHLNLILWI